MDEGPYMCDPLRSRSKANGYSGPFLSEGRSGPEFNGPCIVGAYSNTPLPGPKKAGSLRGPLNIQFCNEAERERRRQGA